MITVYLRIQATPMLSHSQNYLNNKEIVLRLISFVNFQETPLIIEIGPGKGIITDELLKKAQKILVIETDKKLAESLRKRYAGNGKLTIAEDDFLQYELPKETYSVVSNIPFNITADIIRKITSDPNLRCAYLILQKEAAIKFLGAPYAHSPLLSHFLQINFDIGELMPIARTNYMPRPKFDTTFVSFRRKQAPVFEGTEAEQFRDFLVYIFERRKPLIKEALKSVMSNLQVKIILGHLNIPPDRNLKKILFSEWTDIFKTFMAHAPDKSKRAIAGAHKKLIQEQSRLKKEHRTRKDD